MAKKQQFKRSRVALGCEAIAFKEGRSELLTKLAESIKYLRSAETYTRNTINLSKIEQVIFQETGITTNVVIDVECDSWVALFVQSPDIDRNNTMINAIERDLRGNDDISDMLKIRTTSKIGGVDRRTGKVFGLLSELPVTIYITLGALDCAVLSDEEIAAGLIHEIGHPYSFFERLLDNVIINVSSASTAERILKTEREFDRLQLVETFEKVNEVKLANKSVIIQSDSRGEIYTKLILDTLQAKRNENGEEFYNWKGWEFSADQFAVRHGCGSLVASFLDKTGLEAERLSQPVRWAMDMYVFSMIGVSVLAGVGVIAGLYMGIVTSIAAISATLSIDPRTNVYDTPKDRLERMYREYTVALKNKEIKGNLREFYTSEQAQIKQLIEKTNDSSGIKDAIWNYLIPMGRASNKERILQQEIEKLSHNELYNVAAKFRG